MNVKSLFLFLALAGLGTSCTNDEGLEKGSSVTEGSGEIQLVFGGSGEGVDYTKAIASEPETRMKDLDVYVFASDKKEGTYYFVEKWSKQGTTPTAGAKEFVLQTSGANQMASFKPTEIVGLPYLKLYCVANSKPYAQDGKIADELKPEAVTAFDQETSAPTPASPTTADDFEKAFTQKLGGDDGNDPKQIGSFLPMGGVGETKISGSLSKVEIEMTRAVARFDISNDQTTSRLTIESLSVLNGRKNAPLFAGGTLATANDEDTKAKELMEYGEKDFTILTNANRGDVTSALYVYPGEIDDKTFLLIKGKYLNPNNDPIAVSYKIEVNKEGNSIAIGRNSRYMLRIGNVTESQISSAFEIEDWTSNGGVEMKPDNVKPSFTDNNDVLKDIEVVTPDAGEKPEADKTNPYSLRLKNDEGSFKLTAYANSAIEAEIEALTKVASWLEITEQNTADDVANPGRKITTFTFAYTGATGAVPQTVTLRNSAASYDPELWTVLTFNGPFKAPEITVPAADQQDNTVGNLVEVDPGTGAITANMYLASGSAVKLNMSSVDGIKVEAPEWLEVTPVPTKAAGEVIYSIKVAGDVPAETTSAEVKFINASDNTDKPATTVVTVNLKDPAMTAEAGVSEAAKLATDAAGNVTITVDTDKLAAGNFTFKVKAPEGVTAPDFTACTWLTFTEQAWSKENGYAEYTVALASNPAFADYTATFTNAIPNGGNLNVKFVKAPATPKLAANDDASYTDSAFNTFGLNVDNPEAATGTMYLVDNCTAYVKITCDGEAFTVTAPNGMTATKQGETDIYEIKITDRTQFSAGTTAEIVATNSADNSRTSKLTVALQDAAVKVTLTAASYVTETTEGNAIVYTVDYNNMTNTGVSFTVDAHYGATADLSAFENSTWLRKTAGDASVVGDTSMTYTFKAGDGDTQSGDLTINITNTQTGAGDQTVILRRK